MSTELEQAIQHEAERLAAKAAKQAHEDLIAIAERYGVRWAPQANLHGEMYSLDSLAKYVKEIVFKGVVKEQKDCIAKGIVARALKGEKDG